MTLYQRGQQHPAAMSSGSWEAFAALIAPDRQLYSPEFVTQFAAVLDLPQQTRDAVAALDLDEEDKEALLEHLDEVEQALRSTAARGSNLTQMFSIFAPGGEIPRSAAMKSLSMCSRALSRHAPEPTLSADVLARLTESVLELTRELAEADLSPAVKVQLLPYLQQLLLAIQNVQVAGIRPIAVATDALTGDMNRRRRLWTLLKAAPEVVRKLGATLTALNQILAAEPEVQKDAEELTHHIMKMLGAG